MSATQVQAPQPHYSGLNEGQEELEHEIIAIDRIVYDWLTNTDGDVEDKIKKMERLIKKWLKKIRVEVEKSPKGTKDLDRILRNTDIFKT